RAARTMGPRVFVRTTTQTTTALSFSITMDTISRRSATPRDNRARMLCGGIHRVRHRPSRMPGKPLIGPPDHVQWRRPKGSGGLTACTVTFTRCWRCGGLESAIIKDGMLMKLNAGALRIAALSVAVLGFGQVSAAQEAQKMFIEGDIVRGNTPNGN